MQLLPKWVLPPTMPAIYDMESGTALEMTAKVYGAMNTLIEEYNAFVDSVNKRIIEFTAQTEEECNLFAIGLRQEFQDFIDVVELKIRTLENQITNMNGTITDEINNAIKSGDIYVTETYDPETESLNMVVSGGV